jgi:hypothetical protein
MKPNHNGREEEIRNIIRNEHVFRETEATNVLRSTRRPDDYLREIEREDKRYAVIKEALRKYFLTIEEWKKEEGVE